MGEEGVRRGVYRLEGGGGHKPMGDGGWWKQGDLSLAWGCGVGEKGRCANWGSGHKPRETWRRGTSVCYSVGRGGGDSQLQEDSCSLTRSLCVGEWG